MKELWVPLDIRLAAKLPKGRKYSEVEAMFSLQYDCFKGRSATIAGYAKLWMWSPNKIRRFLKTSGVKIEYAENTKGKQNQRGQIVATTPNGNEFDNEQIRFTVLKGSQAITDRSQIDDGSIRDRSEVTTYKTEEKRTKNEEQAASTSASNDQRFNAFWEKYPFKFQREETKKIWDELDVDDQLLEQMLRTLNWQVKLSEWVEDDGRFIPQARTWLIDRRWEDEPIEVFKPIERKPWHGAR